MYFHSRKATGAMILALGAGLLAACSAQQSGSLGLPDGSAVANSASPSSFPYDSSALPNFGSVADSRNVNPMAGKLKANETLGFGANRLLRFIYQQQFDCVVGPRSDLNSIGMPADQAPQQFASPECDIGMESRLAPSGKTLPDTDSLYILVPFFETDKKTPAFTKALGKALKKLFGFVPDAFKPDPGVAVQCPTPADKPGTCTMHPLQINLGPLVAELGLLPKGTNLYVPLVNHDHLLTNGTISQRREWWKLVVVLVEDPKAWPNAAGTTGITSLAKLKAAQMNKQASADVASNFFLYFSSYGVKATNSEMPGMKM
jgi:hypothetical protein